MKQEPLASDAAELSADSQEIASDLITRSVSEESVPHLCFGLPEGQQRVPRLLCVWLPDFPIQRLRCERPAAGENSDGDPLVLYAESGNRAQVVIASSEARLYGVRAGMPLAEAQALLESATFLLHDAEADTRELQSLAERCYHYSPFVGLERANHAHCLLLDISGCAHLFGDESGLARQLVIDLAERGYFVHVAVAGTIGAAWAIARYGHGTGSDRRLRSLPVEALRISDKLVSQLREFDLRTVGQLSALPKDTLPSRFGKVLNERLDQMFGRHQELLEPLPRPEPVSARWATDEPINHPKAVKYVCSDLLTEILAALRSRREGLLELKLQLDSESAASGSADSPAVLEIGLARPTDEPKHILNLLQLKLDTTPLPEWIHTIHLEASVTAPLQIRQQSLFAHQEPTAGEGYVRRLTDRLVARLGRDAVVRPQILPEAIPEQAVCAVPLNESVLSETNAESALLPGLEIVSARPLFLLRPEPVHVTEVASDGVPLNFYWNRHCFQVVRSTRAERIATAWWQDGGSVRRDYYQVESRTGARFWLFQGRNGKWFLHGVFE